MVSVMPEAIIYAVITGCALGQSDPKTILNICWTFAFFGGLGSHLVSFVAGFCYDIEPHQQGGNDGRNL